MNARRTDEEVTRVNARPAIAALALALSGCAGGASLTASTAPEAPPTEMTGRWVLSAPNAPFCGLNFSAPAQGRVSPEGGCPARFFLARRYKLDGDRLTVFEESGETLGQLTASAEGYSGTATTGDRLSLNR